MLRLSHLGVLSACLLGCSTASMDESAPVPEVTTPAKPTNTRFVNVTAQRVPSNLLNGPTMDVEWTDAEGDGDLDLFVAVEFGLNRLLLWNGTQFVHQPDAFPALAYDSEDIALGDFDRDGDVDVVFVSEDNPTNEYYLNDGAGAFTPAPSGFPVGGESNAVIAHDFDADGDLDLLVGNNGQDELLLNNGAGVFEVMTETHLPPRDDVTQDVEAGDIDGDGDLDLIIANEDANGLLLNDGTGRFTDVSDRLPARANEEVTREADFGDVDGDGDLDLYFANFGSPSTNATSDLQDRLLLNDGAGTYTDATNRLPSLAQRNIDVDMLDVDGDGDLDLLVATFAPSNGPRVFLNDGTATFTEATNEVFDVGALVGSFACIDLEYAEVDGRRLLHVTNYFGEDLLLEALATDG
ncbi:MAG: VCBS repeat-containing protein [Bacteroidota bacterium]